MSQKNVELAGEVVDAVEQRNLPRLIELTDPQVEWHSAFAELAEGGIYHGHSGLRQYMQDMNDAWEIVRADVDDSLGVGDIVVLIGRIHYRGRGSGIEAELPAGFIVRFCRGRVVCFRAFREPEQALDAVALPG